MAKVLFSSLADGLRGKVGNVVFSRARSGATVRQRVTPANRRTPAQVSVRDNFGDASRAYTFLTDAQIASWDFYGGSQTRTNAATGEQYTLTGNMAYNELGAKFRQVNPSGTIPVNPPVTSFGGDNVIVEVEILGQGLRFDGNVANAAGVTTEILLQRLVSRTRRPSPNGYRTVTFHAFVAGTPLQFSVEPGVYVPAYRFVRLATGQMSLLIPMQKLVVEA